MMRLPGTEQWSPELVSSRIAFERNVARVAPDFLTELADNDGFVNAPAIGRSGPSDAIFALTRAVELAFATGNIDLAREIAEELLEKPYARPRTPWQFALYATIGSSFGSMKLILSGRGAQVIRAGAETEHTADDVQRLSWPTNSSIELAELMSVLFPAAAASDPSGFFMSSVFQQAEDGLRKPAAFAAFSASLEHDVIESLPERDGIPRELLALEARYSRQVRLLQFDVFHWRTVRPRGSIIDWPLLALWVATFRSGKASTVAERLVPESGEAVFMRSLASDLAG
jgi:hypothetical protein